MTNVQYITDAAGQKTAVILPIEDYEEMLEDLHFGEVARDESAEFVGTPFVLAFPHQIDVIGLRSRMVLLRHPVCEDRVSPQLLINPS